MSSLSIASVILNSEKRATNVVPRMAQGIGKRILHPGTVYYLLRMRVNTDIMQIGCAIKTKLRSAIVVVVFLGTEP
jgi:hypothetical protein